MTITVGTILNLAEDDTIVRIIDDMSGETLAIYDGKDSIDDEWNEFTVLGISSGLEHGDSTLDIYTWSEDE